MEKTEGSKIQWMDPEMVKLGMDLSAVGSGCDRGSEADTKKK